MNMQTAKTPKDINLSGVSIEFDREDGHIKAITLRDAAGGMLRVTATSGYSLQALVPAPRKLVARWQLKAKLGLVDIDETFEHEYQADTRKRELGLNESNSTTERTLVQE